MAPIAEIMDLITEATAHEGTVSKCEGLKLFASDAVREFLVTHQELRVPARDAVTSLSDLYPGMEREIHVDLEVDDETGKESLNFFLALNIPTLESEQKLFQFLRSGIPGSIQKIRHLFRFGVMRLCRP